jgi:ATP-dependent DNA helicase RecG
MPETQIIEYKPAWREEFLRWICGFANAQGGTLFIGKDDAGNVIGVKNSKKLMEDLPNKITTVLGIVADVKTCTKRRKAIISKLLWNHNPIR